MLNGRAEDLPMYAIQIVDKDLNVQTRYEKQGFYLGSVEVEDSRIHIQRLVKNAVLDCRSPLWNSRVSDWS